MRIGVVGYSRSGFDVEMAEAYLIAVIAMQVVKPGVENLSDLDVTIVSGLTMLGIPKIAYEIAERYSWRTIGIACSKASEYPQYPCDLVHIIGDNWGDESAAFLAAIDVLIRVGGGKQSLAETARAKELGIPVIERELPIN